MGHASPLGRPASSLQRASPENGYAGHLALDRSSAGVQRRRGLRRGSSARVSEVAGPSCDQSPIQPLLWQLSALSDLVSCSLVAGWHRLLIGRSQTLFKHVLDNLTTAALDDLGLVVGLSTAVRIAAAVRARLSDPSITLATTDCLRNPALRNRPAIAETGEPIGRRECIMSRSAGWQTCQCSWRRLCPPTPCWRAGISCWSSLSACRWLLRSSLSPASAVRVTCPDPCMRWPPPAAC